jgi:predicted MFS family arabinose efflux permease
VLCAVAPTLAVLILARALQGVSGGLLVPTGQNIVLRAIRPERMGRMFGGLILLPLYFEALRGQSVVHTGLLLLAYGFGAMEAMPIGGRLSDRIGSGITCIAGLALTIVATIPFVFLHQDTDLVTVALLHALRSVGVGLAGIPAMTAAVRAALNHLADATTMGNILQRVGGSLGSAIMVTDGQRKRRKNPRICSTSDSGCSSAAKWPPRGSSSNQRRSVNRSSASRRDGRVISRG